MKVTPQARGSGSPFTWSYRPHFIPVVMTTLLRAALEMLRIQASYYRQENNTPERESPGAVRGLGSGGDAEFEPLASLAPVPDLLFLPKKIVRGSFRGGKPKDSREEGQMVIHGLFCGWVCEQGLPPRPHESCLLTAGPADFGSVTGGRILCSDRLQLLISIGTTRFCNSSYTERPANTLVYTDCIFSSLLKVKLVN